MSDATKKKLKITKVPLPDFFIALVLPDVHAHRQPSQGEVDELRDRTTEFWTTQLKETSFPKKFKKLNLKIERTQFGTVNEEQADIEVARDLDPRFNMYVEFSGVVHFASRGSGVPSGNEAFAEMTASDSLEYLVGYVRGMENDCLFANATEVCARRLVIDPMAEGGNVRAPTFFFAFATEPWDDETPKGPPTDEDVEVFRQKTHDHIDRNLKMAYPNSYEGSEMKVLVHEADSAKPDERFDVYIENDFKASFSSDPPTEAELFNVIMKCGASDCTEYLQSMQKIKKSRFEDVTTVTVQIVGLEMPEVEDMEPAPEQQSESPEGDPPEDDEEHAIERQVPIFLAVCTNTDPPNPEEVKVFDELMVRYFYTVVQKEYPDIVKNLSLKKLYTKFDQGIPEPRFNMCSEWNAIITFKPESEPPDEKELNMLIIECNMSTILAYVRKLEPVPFKSTTEVTMRRHSQKPGPDDPIMDARFEAAIKLPATPELLEPPEDEAEKERKRLDAEKEKQRLIAEKEREKQEAEERKKAEDAQREAEAKKKAEESRKAAEAEAKRKAEEERKQREAEERVAAKEEARRLAEEQAKAIAEEEVKKKAREERLKKAAEAKAALLKAEAKRKKEKKEKKKEIPAPVDDGHESPDENLPRVKTSDVFVALKLDHAETEPNEDEMETLRSNTEAYFAERLKNKYPNTFASLKCQVGVMKWNEGYPKPEFNFYVEWDITAKFRDSADPSSPMKTVAGTKQRTVFKDEAGGGDTPTSYELMRSLVVGANIIQYLTESVRVIGGPFEHGTAVYIKQRESS
ncbi:hypothetical protein IV203_003357 [Nitzschia inconspicua]|uniref:Uncharacterized protein n=1 Tax=Nitzschia inconspicua TaxID=303405 RepID=A0A9K3L3D1_9STRA|nr:hypothetical protein IV203_017543 [Nitzschia inconspicua]KAG7354001.1 hypothetical protein IV203_003357 [Nitzschia inconspicua]